MVEAHQQAIAPRQRQRGPEMAEKFARVLGLFLADLLLANGGWVYRPLRADSFSGDPLVGEALWGVSRTMDEATKTTARGEWLFPRDAVDGDVKGNHASATLNRWMRTLPGVEGTTHSFRHAMRDRMRAASIPEDIRDAIYGHGMKSVGERYGSGHSLRLLRDHMVKVVISSDGIP